MLRTEIIQAIIKKLEPYYPEQMEAILKGYKDNDLIAYAQSIGINTDVYFMEVL